MKQHLPNAITCLNLFSGCIGVVLAFEGQLIDAGYAILIAAIFDFLDGLVARALKVSSPIGKELDSLADIVSFGFLPSVILFKLFNLSPAIADSGSWIKYTAFLVAICSALRLAKFNLDPRQNDVFFGLPTPACAIFILSLPHIAMSRNLIASEYVQNPVILIALTLTLSFLLVAELPLMSLKFSNFNFSTNLYRYLLLALSLILIIILQFTAIPLIIMLYLILSIFQFRNA